MKKLLSKRILRFAALVSLACSLAANAEDNTREFQIKAAYLYNLIKFIDWPATQNDSAEGNNIAATHICVLGRNPFGPHLDKLESRTANGKAIKVRYLNVGDNLANCDIAYLSKYLEHNPEMMQQLGDIQGLLTVGTTQQFIDTGGMIALVVVENSVQVRINHSITKAAGFIVSGNLLEIAKVVQ